MVFTVLTIFLESLSGPISCGLKVSFLSKSVSKLDELSNSGVSLYLLLRLHLLRLISGFVCNFFFLLVWVEEDIVVVKGF